MHRWYRSAIALVFAVGLAACDDDSTGPDLEAQIVGTWDVQTINGNSLPFTISETFGSIVCSSTVHHTSVTFRSNGSFTETGRISGGCTDGTGAFDDTYTENGTFSINGNQITTRFTGEDPQTTTFAISGSTFTTTRVEDGETMTVIAVRR